MSSSDTFLNAATIGHVHKLVSFFLRSILGMHLFGCKFGWKTDNGDTIPDRKNFDSLLWAIVTVFQVSFTLSPPPQGRLNFLDTESNVGQKPRYGEELQLSGGAPATCLT